jgi:hypothetical protein
VNFRNEAQLDQILYDDGNETDSSAEAEEWDAASRGIHQHVMAKKRERAALFNRPAQDLFESRVPDEHPNHTMITEFPKTAEDMIDGLVRLGYAMQDPLAVSPPRFPKLE